MNIRCFYQLHKDMRSIILTFVLTILPTYLAQDCQPGKSSTSHCSCTSGDFVLDLEPLVKDSGQKPLFNVTAKDQQQKDVQFFYKPCNPFNEGPASGCQEVAACQKADNGRYYSLGRQTTVQYNGDPHKGNVTFKYNATQESENYTRVAVVEIVCSKQKNPVFKFNRETHDDKQKMSTYSFVLYTELACVPNGGLSVGSILLIIFFVFLLVYLIGGMLFLRFVRGAKGWEQVPNYEFWYEFPLYVRDGVVFTINGCKTETTYEKI